MPKKSTLLILLLALVLLAGIGIMLREGPFWRSTLTGPQTSPAADFTLESADGPVSLHDFRGKVVLLYFGYTSCPDICPTSLSRMAQALSLLGREERDRVRVLLVTVDPERDTPARLKEYASFFSPNIIGLSGTPKTIARVAKQYGAAFHKHTVASSLGYVVDHTALVYVIGKNGELRTALPHGASPQDMLPILRAALASPA
ncbi:MAG: SCO family protein [Sulfuricellaceae bacterium]|nr:SCO family protein [Sulfuricellaceae bacterium]